MKSGDRFIWYGKTGSVTGIVDRITDKTVYDITNGIKINKKTIICKEGVKYNYNNCYRITADISPVFLKRLLKTISTVI